MEKFSQAVIEKIGYFDTTFKSAGDYDFVVRLCLKDFKSVKVSIDFVTFRFGGISDINQVQSVNEVAALYKKNYNPLSKISDLESQQIYCQTCERIPPALAWELKDHQDYFDFEKYYRVMFAYYAEIRDRDMKLQQIEHDFGYIYNSQIWKLLKKIGVMLFPAGSWRRRMLEKFIR